MPYWLKTLIFYVSTLILLRFAGKRALAQMGVLEAVVMIALGTLLVHPLKSQTLGSVFTGGRSLF